MILFISVPFVLFGLACVFCAFKGPKKPMPKESLEFHFLFLTF
jgi:hypothetical protein